MPRHFLLSPICGFNRSVTGIYRGNYVNIMAVMPWLLALPCHHELMDAYRPRRKNHLNNWRFLSNKNEYEMQMSFLSFRKHPIYEGLIVTGPIDIDTWLVNINW